MVALIHRDGRIAATILLLVLACSGLSTAAVAHGRTIVGTWAPDPRQCTPVGGLIAIGPLNVQGDDFRCDFHDISRIGDVVTWHGWCGFPEHARRTTVVATLRADVLTVDIDGAESGPYRRCRR